MGRGQVDPPVPGLQQGHGGVQDHPGWGEAGRDQGGSGSGLHRGGDPGGLPQQDLHREVLTQLQLGLLVAGERGHYFDCDEFAIDYKFTFVFSHQFSDFNVWDRFMSDQEMVQWTTCK